MKNSTLKLSINLSEEYPFIVDRIWEAVGNSEFIEVVLWFDEKTNNFSIDIYDKKDGANA